MEGLAASLDFVSKLYVCPRDEDSAAGAADQETLSGNGQTPGGWNHGDRAANDDKRTDGASDRMFGRNGPTEALALAEHVDLDRYFERWYIIANIPYFAERGNVGT